MTRQVRPTSRKPVRNTGLRDRSSDEDGMCANPSGPGSDASHHEAGYMVATDLPCLRSAHPLQARGGPYMLRGPGVTPAAKRTQRACRPRDRASKVTDAEPTLLTHRKATSSALDWPGVGGPPGSKSGACTQGSSRNLGDLVFSTVERRRGRRGRSGPGPRGIVRPRGSEGGRSGGSAERRKRSEARGEARSRSRLIGTDEVGELTPEDPAEGKRPTG